MIKVVLRNDKVVEFDSADSASTYGTSLSIYKEVKETKSRKRWFGSELYIDTEYQQIAAFAQGEWIYWEKK